MGLGAWKISTFVTGECQRCGIGMLDFLSRNFYPIGFLFTDKAKNRVGEANFGKKKDLFIKL
jgi:hypothetical protein